MPHTVQLGVGGQPAKLFEQQRAELGIGGSQPDVFTAGADPERHVGHASVEHSGAPVDAHLCPVRVLEGQAIVPHSGVHSPVAVLVDPLDRGL